MARNPIGPYPLIQLAHHDGGTYLVVAAVAYYVLSPIAIPRPDEGDIVVEMPCGACGEKLTFRVFDRNTVIIKRMQWIILTLVGIGAVFLGLKFNHNTVAGLIGFLGGGLTIYSYAHWTVEDGVRIEKATSPHSLRFLRRRDRRQRSTPLD